MWINGPGFARTFWGCGSRSGTRDSERIFRLETAARRRKEVVVLSHDGLGRGCSSIDHLDGDHGSRGNDRTRWRHRPAVGGETETSLICFGKIESAWGMKDSEVSHEERGDGTTSESILYLWERNMPALAEN